MDGNETIFTLGLSVNVVPAWSVILYLILSSVFVLMRQIPLYLLTTQVFTVSWSFALYWERLLSGASSFTTAFPVYMFCGLAIVNLAIVAYSAMNSYDFSVALRSCDRWVIQATRLISFTQVALYRLGGQKVAT